MKLPRATWGRWAAEHPGFILERELRQRELTPRAFADASGVNLGEIKKLLSGKKPITPLMALRITATIEGRAEYWLALQGRWDAAAARKEHGRFADGKPDPNRFPMRGPAFGLAMKRRGMTVGRVSVLTQMDRADLEAFIGGDVLALASVDDARLTRFVEKSQVWKENVDV